MCILVLVVDNHYHKIIPIMYLNKCSIVLILNVKNVNYKCLMILIYIIIVMNSKSLDVLFVTIKMKFINVLAE